MRVVGVDPGISGALAVVVADGEYDVPHLEAVYDLPVNEVHVGKKIRRRIDIQGLFDLFDKADADFIYLEEVGVMPHEGSVGAFSFGKTAGVIEAAAVRAGCPYAFLRPADWKKAVGIPPRSEKDESRLRASRRFPEGRDWFKRKKDDGRAEAALIAVAGLLTGTAHPAFTPDADALGLVQALGVPCAASGA